MNNKKKFKETFERIALSNDALGELERLEVKRSTKSYVKPVVAFAMMCALVLFTGVVLFDSSKFQVSENGAIGKIFYAAETELEEEQIDEEKNEDDFYDLPKEEVRFTKENVLVNNDRLSEDVVEFYVDEEGFYCYKMKDDSFSKVLVKTPEVTSILKFSYETERGGNSGLTLQFDGKLEKVDERIYLRLKPYEPAKDITEDFQDGIASAQFYYEFEGLYEIVKATLEYRVEGTWDDYTVDVWFVEE